MNRSQWKSKHFYLAALEVTQTSLKFKKNVILVIIFGVSLQLLFSSRYLAKKSLQQSALQIEGMLVDNQLQSWMRKSPALASKLNPPPLPNETRPFIFFHIRKGGGSSLRQIISDAAIQHDLKQWIPCNNGLPCVPYDHPPHPERRKLSKVYASHLNYVEMSQYIRVTRRRDQTKTVTLEDHKNATFRYLDDEYPLFDCMTNIRPTVSRVRSCWNFRFNQLELKTWKIPLASDLSPKDWEILLPQIMDEYNNGCNNEIARAFGSTIDEHDVNQMTDDSKFLMLEFNKIAARLSRCVIIRVDRCEESNMMISHFFPWMNKTNICSEHSNPTILKQPRNDTLLQQNVSDVILKLNYMDEKIFQFAEVLFEEQ